MTAANECMRELIARYGFALDRRDFIALQCCFDDQAVGDCDGQPLLRGPTAIVAAIRAAIGQIETTRARDELEYV